MKMLLVKNKFDEDHFLENRMRFLHKNHCFPASVLQHYFRFTVYFQPKITFK